MKSSFIFIALILTGHLVKAKCDFDSSATILSSRADTAESNFSESDEIALYRKAGAEDVCITTKNGTVYLVASWKVMDGAEFVKTVLPLQSTGNSQGCSRIEIQSGQTNNFAAENYTHAVEELKKQCSGGQIMQPVWNATTSSRDLRLPGAYHEYGYWSSKCRCR